MNHAGKCSLKFLDMSILSIDGFSNGVMQIELMVPPNSVAMKNRIQNYGRRLKIDKIISSFQSLETKQDGEWKMQLKIFLRGKGSFTIYGNDLQNFDTVSRKTRSIVESQNGIGIDRLFQMEE